MDEAIGSSCIEESGIYDTKRWPFENGNHEAAAAQGGFKKKPNCSSRRKEAHFEENQWNRASLRRLLRILESALPFSQSKNLCAPPSRLLIL